MRGIFVMNNINFDMIKLWANDNQGFLSILFFLIALVITIFSGFFKWFLRLIKKNCYKVISGDKRFILKSGKSCQNIQGESITVNQYDK